VIFIVYNYLFKYLLLLVIGAVDKKLFELVPRSSQEGRNDKENRLTFCG
jgi:hypothetical protein